MGELLHDGPVSRCNMTKTENTRRTCCGILISFLLHIYDVFVLFFSLGLFELLVENTSILC